MPAFVREEECISCSACVSVCPVSVIEMNDDAKAFVNEGCIECSDCINTCPVSCIEMQ